MPRRPASHQCYSNLTLCCVVQEATEADPSDEEVSRAKEASLNQFVFNFASSSAQLQVSYFCFLPSSGISCTLFSTLTPRRRSSGSSCFASFLALLFFVSCGKEGRASQHPGRFAGQDRV
jgi:hypothetical protein